MTLPASEETVPATDRQIAKILKEMDTGWPSLGDEETRSLIARIKIEREQAVRECAEKLNDYIAASWSDSEALGFEQARDAILSLIDRSAKT